MGNYTKQVWQKGDVISADKLLHIEDGIGANDNAISTMKVAMTIGNNEQNGVLQVGIPKSDNFSGRPGSIVTHGTLTVNGTTALNGTTIITTNENQNQLFVIKRNSDTAFSLIRNNNLSIYEINASTAAATFQRITSDFINATELYTQRAALGEGLSIDTRKSSNNRIVAGKYNQSEASQVEIVGWGSDDSHRKNIRTLDSSGNEELAGTLTLNSLIATDAITGSTISSSSELTAATRVTTPELRLNVSESSAYTSFNIATLENTRTLTIAGDNLSKVRLIIEGDLQVNGTTTTNSAENTISNATNLTAVTLNIKTSDMETASTILNTTGITTNSLTVTNSVSFSVNSAIITADTTIATNTTINNNGIISKRLIIGTGNNVQSTASGIIVAGKYADIPGINPESLDQFPYAEVIGGGTDAARKNIRTLNWEGDEVLARDLTVGRNLNLTGSLIINNALTISVAGMTIPEITTTDLIVSESSTFGSYSNNAYHGTAIFNTTEVTLHGTNYIPEALYVGAVVSGELSGGAVFNVPNTVFSGDIKIDGNILMGQTTLSEQELIALKALINTNNEE